MDRAERIASFGTSWYTNQTNIHPITLIFILFFLTVILLAPRRYVIIPLLLVQSFITPAQNFSLGGIDFSIMRIMILFTLLRILLRRENNYFIAIKLDKILMLYGIVSILAYTLQLPNFSSFINVVGVALDNLGGFFVVRILIRGDDDIKIIIKTLSISVVILFFFFLYEVRTATNIFSFFNDFRSDPIIRDGRLRAQGAYPHPILAGSFWAAMVPLFMGYWKQEGKWRPSMIIGVILGTSIIYFCASSTPMMSLAFGFGATIFFYQRASFTDLKLLIITGVTGLMLFWSKPIWYLFTKIDIAGGSTGYFRYLLIDRFVRHWKEWFLIGIRSTYHWGEGLGLASVGLADLPNQYIFEGVRYGALGLSLFIAAIITALNYIGIAIRTALVEEARIRYWQIGVSLLVHMFTFLGVSYFGAVRFSWWMTLAIAGCLYQNNVLLAKGQKEGAT
jgi:hypothetical protein